MGTGAGTTFKSCYELEPTQGPKNAPEPSGSLVLLKMSTPRRLARTTPQSHSNLCNFPHIHHFHYNNSINLPGQMPLQLFMSFDAMFY